MTRLLLRDLTPGTAYKIQLRAAEGDSVSEWSRLFDLTTTADTGAPSAPAWPATPITVDGTSFLIQWLSINHGLETNKDFSHYQLELSANGRTTTVKTTNIFYTLTFEENVNLFAVASPVVNARVRAVDATGNVSPWSSSVQGTNPRPAAPTTLAAAAATDQISLSWPASVDSDVVKYKVFTGTTSGFTPLPGNKIFEGSALAFSYTTTTYSPQWFKVTAVDVFGQESLTATTTAAAVTPVSPFTVDTTPPSVPTNVSATTSFDATRREAKIAVSWTASSSTDVAEYIIRYGPSSTGPWSYVKTSKDATSASIEALAGQQYYLGVSAADWSANYSGWATVANSPIYAGTDSVAPDQVTGLTAVSKGTSFVASWSPVVVNDLRDYEVNVTDGTTNLTYRTNDTRFDFPIEFNRAVFGSPKATVTFKVRAVDFSELAGAWSANAAVTAPTPTAPTGLVGTTGANSITINWAAPAGDAVSGYNVYQGTAANPTTRAAFVNGTTFTTTVNTQAQYFTVKSVNAFGAESTALSAGPFTASDPFLRDSTPPAVPTALAATLTNNANGVGGRAAVTWSNGTDTDRAGSELHYKVTSDTVWSSTHFGPDATSTTLELPYAYTAYQFRVRAYDGAGNFSAWSSTLSKTAVSNTAPSAVTGLTATTGRDSITYNWNNVADADLKYYEVTFSTSSTFASGNITYTPTASSLTVSGLNATTTYYARVRSVDTGSLTSAWTATNTSTTKAFPLTPLSDGNAPTNSPTPTVSGGIGYLYISWPAATNADPVTYDVHLSPTSGFTANASTLATTTSATSATLLKGAAGAALVYGTTYYAKIVARDVDGSGPVGAQASGSIMKATGVDLNVNPRADFNIPTIFIQNTQPSSGMKIDDVWFDEDGKMEEYVYTAGGWRSVRDGTIADAQATANTATTAAGTAQTSANNAQTAANTAQSTATNAQSIADQGYSNKNVTFSDWTGSIPASWVSLVGPAPTKDTVNAITKPNAVKFNVPANNSNYFNQTIQVTPATEYITVQTQVMLSSGDWSGSGMLIRWHSNEGFRDTVIKFNVEFPGMEFNRWNLVRKTLKRPDNMPGALVSVQFYVMGGYSVLGAITAKEIVFDSAGITNSTEAEIAAYNAATKAEAALLTTNLSNLSGVVDGKGRVYFQNNAPTGDSNSLWVDTTGGANMPKRWNGSSWAPVPDAGIQAAAAAAADANAAAGIAHTAAQNAQTSAGNAQTAADNAQADATVAKDIATNPGGARNLLSASKTLLNSNIYSWLATATPYNAATRTIVNTAGPFVNQNGTVVNVDAVNLKVFAESQIYRMREIKTVGWHTFSFWAKSDSASNVSVGIDLNDLSPASITVTPTWQKFTYTANNTRTPNATYNFIDVQPYGSNLGILIYQPMLEIGRSPSDYSPSPEEVDKDAFNYADASSKTYIQSAAPVGRTQDLWIDTTSGINMPKRWNGSGWVGVTDKAATDAAAAATASSVTYIQNAAPTGRSQDLWIDTTSGNNTPKRWNGSAWVAVTDKTATDAVAAAAASSKVYIQTATPAGRSQDLWIDTTGGLNTPKRWSGSAWVATTDKAATDAAAAATASSMTYIQTTAPAGRSQDLWIDTSGGTNTPKRWNGSAWVAVTDKIATDAAAAALAAQNAANTANAAAATAQSTANQATTDAATAAGIANGKAVVLYQTTAPAAEYRNALTLWIDTTGNSNTPKRWTTGTTWVAVTDKVATDAASVAATANAAAATADAKAVTAQQAADGKGKVYYQTVAPSPALAQDLWVDTTNGNNTPKRWSGSAWVAVTDKVATDAAAAASNALAAAVYANQFNSLIFDGGFERDTEGKTIAALGTNNNIVTSGGKFGSKYLKMVRTAAVPHPTVTWSITFQEDRVYEFGIWAKVPTTAPGNGVVYGRANMVTRSGANYWPSFNKSVPNDNVWRFYSYRFDTYASNDVDNYTGSFLIHPNGATDPLAELHVDGAYLADVTAQVEAETALSAAQASSTVYYQSTAPGSTNGQDLWIDTTGNNNTPKRWNGSAWVVVTDKVATDASALASTKGTVYFQTTAPASTLPQDLWIDTASSKNTPKRYLSGTWAAVTDKVATDAAALAATANTTANTASSTATTALNTATGKNKVIFSDSNASGTSGYVAGDVWFKRDANDNVIGQWRFNGTSWVSTYLSDQVISSLTVGKLTSGSLTSTTMTLGPGGVVKSNNFVTGSTGWQLSETGLEINGGSIKIGAVSSLQSTLDAKETPTGAQAKATAAQTAATSAAAADATTKADKAYYDARNVSSIINNFSTTGDTKGWGHSASTYENVDFFGAQVKSLKTVTSGDTYVASTDYVDLDDTKAYQFSMWVKRSATLGAPITYGSFYVGTTTSGDNKIIPVNPTTGIESAPSANFYSSINMLVHDQWTKIVFYIFPSQATTADMANRQGSTISSNAKMRPGYNRLLFRFLNYYNAGRETTSWMVHPTLTEIPLDLIRDLRTDALGAASADAAAKASTAQTAAISAAALDATNKANAAQAAAATDATTKAGNAQTAAAVDATEKARLAQVAAIDDQTLSLNSTFDDWTGTNPAQWSTWGTGPTKETTLVRTGRYAQRWNVAAGTDAGNTSSGSWNSVPFNNYIVIEADIMLVSGSLGGAGVYLYWSQTVLGASANRVTTTRWSNIIPNPTLGKWYRISYVDKAPAGVFDNISQWTGYGGHVMANHSSFGTKSAKDIVVDRMGIRHATAEEIQAYEANGNLSAAVSTLNTSIGNKLDTTAFTPVSSKVTNWTASDGVLLNGGKIFAGSVTTDQLAANSVKANQLSVIIGAGNLIPDSSMESPNFTTNWQTNGGANTVSRSSEKVRTSGFSAKITGAATGSSTYMGLSSKGYIPLQPNTTYTYSAWVYNQGSAFAGYGLRLHIHLRDTNTSIISQPTSDPATLPNAWQRLSITFTTGPTIDRCNVYVITDGPVRTPASTIAYVDDLQLEEGDVTTSWNPMTNEILPGTITSAMISTAKLDASVINTSQIIVNQAQVTSLVSDLAAKETPSGAQTKATAAQTAAVQAAATDATTKASNAQTAAETFAKSVAPGTINLFSGGEAEWGSSRIAYAYTAVHLAPYVGKRITVSFDMKVTIPASISIYAYQSNGISIDAGTYVSATTSWQRFSFVTTVRDYGINNQAWTLGSIAHYDSTNASNVVMLRNYKIEIGETATPFSLSPSDAQVAAAADAAAKASAAQTAAEATAALDATAKADDAIVKARNLVEVDVSKWDTSGAGTFTRETVDFNGVNVSAMASESGDNFRAHSPYFNVEPTQAYEVRFWLKDPTSTGTGTQFYAGINAVNLGSNNADTVLASTGVVNNTNSSNVYSVYVSGATPGWTEFVYYILPVGASGDEVANLGKGNLHNVRMSADTHRMRIRFLNWTNTGTARKYWLHAPSVTTVSMEAIRASSARSEAARAAAVASASTDATSKSSAAQTAAISAAAADATTKANLEAARAVDALTSNLNASFNDWTGTHPTGNTAWSSNPIKETVLRRTGNFSARWNTTTAADMGMNIGGSFSAMPYSEFVAVEADVYLADPGGGVVADFSGAGILLDWPGLTGNTRNSIAFKDSVPSPQYGKWYKITRIVKRPSPTGTWSAFAGYVMANYATSLGARATKNIIFDRVGIRAASDVEIQAYEADADLAGSVQMLQGEIAAAEQAAKTYADTTYSGTKTKVTNWTASDGTKIDGGRIFTGSVTTDQLAANSVTANQLNVIVGGANLVKNGHFSDGSNASSIDGWYTVGTSSRTMGASTLMGHPYNNYLAMNNSTSDARYEQIVGTLQAGTKYVLSAYVYKQSGATDAQNRGIAILVGSDFYSQMYLMDGTPVSMSAIPNSYTRVYIPFTVGSSNATAVIRLQGSTNTGTYNYGQIMLTQGDVVGAYSPRADEILPGTIQGNMVKAGTIEGDIFKTGTGIASDMFIKSTLTMGDASNTGIIQSFGYNATSGFQLSKTGLTIRGAGNSIHADSINAGTLNASRVRIGSGTTFDSNYDPASKATPSDVDLAKKVTRLGGQVMKFNNIVGGNQQTSNWTGSIVIETPITFSAKMTNIHLTGYNYLAAKADIDVTVSFYAYMDTNHFVSTAQSSKGSRGVNVRLGSKDNKVVIILDTDDGGVWQYPSILVESAQFGYSSTPPDSWKDGWSTVFTNNLSAYSIENTPQKQDITRNSTLVDNWNTTGTTLIDGGKIFTGSIQAGSINTTNLVVTQNNVTGLVSDLAAKETPLGAQTKADNAAALAAEAARAKALDAAWMFDKQDFSDWTTGNVPPGWGLTGSNNTSRNTSIVRTGGASLKWIVPAAADAYINNTTNFKFSNAQYVTVEADVYLESGDFRGTGILFDFNQNSGSGYRIHFRFHDVNSTPTTGVWHRFTKVLKCSAVSSPSSVTSYRMYWMPSWSGFGQGQYASTTYLDRIAARPSTQEEITAYEAPGALDTASTSTLNSAKTYADTVSATTRTNSVTDVKNLWGHPSNTTQINGGVIRANTIGVGSLIVSDFNNYWPDRYNNQGMTPDGDGVASGSVAFGALPPTGGNSIRLRNRDNVGGPFISASAGEEFLISITYKNTGKAGNVGLTPTPGVWQYKATGTNITVQQPYSNSFRTKISDETLTDGWTRTTYKVRANTGATDLAYVRLYLSLSQFSPYTDEVDVSDIVFMRRNAGNLLVDGTIDATQIVAGGIDVDGLIKSNSTWTKTLILGTSGTPGVIQSYNYNSSTGFRLSSAGLDIQQGTINARTLVTSSLTSATITLGSGGILRTTNDAVIITQNGITLSGSAIVNAAAIQSSTTITATNLTLNGNMTVANSGYIQSTAYPSNNGFKLDANGIIVKGANSQIYAESLRGGSLSLSGGNLNVGSGDIVTNGGRIRSNDNSFILSSSGLVVTNGSISATALTTGTIGGTNTITMSGANAKIVAGSWSLSGDGLSIPNGGIKASHLDVTFGGENLLPDGSIDNNPVMRSAALTHSFDSNFGRRGGKSLKLVTQGGQSNPYTYRIMGTDGIPNLESNKTYTQSAWIYIDPVNPVGSQGVTFCVSGAMSALPGEDSYGAVKATATGVWTRIWQTFVTNSNANVNNVNSLIRIQGYTPPAGVTFWVDDWKIEEGEYPTAYSPKSDEILPGTIQGNMVKAGTIEGDIFKSDTAITNNMNVKSTLTVGGGGSAGYIRSDNYNTTTTGWQIDHLGNATFNQATIRGTVHASAGSFTGTVTATSGTFTGTVNAAAGSITGTLDLPSGGNLNLTGATAGNINLGATSGGSRVQLNRTGIYSYNSAGTLSVSISTNGHLFAQSAAISNGAITVGTGSISGQNFALDSTGLTITGLTGSSTIDGSVIKTGAIQSTNYTGGTTTPQWSINTAGAAVLTALSVRGNTVVGTGVGDTVSQIASSGYVAGTSGWAIKATGDADFNSVNMRGTLVSGNTTDATRVEVGTYVNPQESNNNWGQVQFYSNDAAYQPGRIWATKTDHTGATGIQKATLRINSPYKGPTTNAAGMELSYEPNIANPDTGVASSVFYAQKMEFRAATYKFNSSDGSTVDFNITNSPKFQIVQGTNKFNFNPTAGEGGSARISALGASDVRRGLELYGDTIYMNVAEGTNNGLQFMKSSTGNVPQIRAYNQSVSLSFLTDRVRVSGADHTGYRLFEAGSIYANAGITSNGDLSVTSGDIIGSPTNGSIRITGGTNYVAKYGTNTGSGTAIVLKGGTVGATTEGFNDASFTSANTVPFYAKSIYGFGAYNNASDLREKNSVVAVDGNFAKDTIKNLTIRSFKMQNDVEPDRTQYGIIAQEAKLVLPSAITNMGERLGASYQDFFAVNVRATQELIKENEEFKEKNNELETRLAELEALVQGLINQ